MSKKSIVLLIVLVVIGALITYVVVFTPFRSNKAYQYNENDGIFVFYKTDNEELYRELLPEEFDMPDELLVHLFVMDFYDIDSDAEPYKEMSISLIAKLDGEDVWHCIYMPVTSEQSMIAGQVGLGLPKTMGSIEFIREDTKYTGTIVDHVNRTGSITVDTTNHTMTHEEENLIKSYMDIKKINILDGEFIQMTSSRGQINVIDISKEYPDLLSVTGGVVSINFDTEVTDTPHPFDLVPTEYIAAYYLHNEIPFSLDRK